jgi:hypothetical protein
MMALSGVLFALAAVAADTPRLDAPRHVIYVGDPGTDRGRQYVEFLKARFPRAEGVKRDQFDPSAVAGADVVLLDWSQADAHPQGDYEFPHPERRLKSPLGSRAKWARPTVLLGSAGHLMAACWQVHGGMG